jgi:outer membrane protein TolC
LRLWHALGRFHRRNVRITVNVFLRLAVCLAAGGLVGSLAWAQPASPPAAASSALGLQADPGAPSLRTSLDAAWTRALGATQSEGQRRRAEAERAVAGSLWAAPPALELNHRDDRLQSNAGRRETEIGVAWPLWLPGQRAARGAAAQAAVEQAQAAEQAARLRLAGEVREAAGLLALLLAETSQAETRVQALQGLAADVARRVQAGDLAPADALAAQAEQLDAAAQQADAQQRLQAAGARWTLLTGLVAAPDLAAETGPAAPPANPTAMADATAAHPELHLAQRSAALARQRLELLQRSRRDAPELSFSLRHDTPGRAAAAQGSVAVGLRLPLGTADRNQPLEAAALSELELAQALEVRLRERLASEALSAQHALQAATVQLQAEQARAHLLRQRAGLIEQSFRAGESPLPDLLRALAAAAQADSAVARQTAALGLARARLPQAFGVLP